MRYRLLVAAVPVLAGTGGCYGYVPASDPSALAGRRAMVSLTDSGSVVLGPRIGAGVVELEGGYAGDSAGAHVLLMALSRQRNGAETDWKGERIAIPHALVSRVEERRFSASRSLFAGALAAVGLGAVTAALRGTGSGGGGANPTLPRTPQ